MLSRRHVSDEGQDLDVKSRLSAPALSTLFCSRIFSIEPPLLVTMVTLARLTLGVAWAASVASCAAITPRLAHDKIQAFPETVPDDLTGRLYKRYKPSLHVIHGCTPYPAVDAEGNTK